MTANGPEQTWLPKNKRYAGNKREKIDPYLFSDAIAIAVDVALVTNRPLLVSGPPGSGKSQLARAVAALLKWNFIDCTITSRTRLETLTVDVDHLARLHDAQRAAISGADAEPEQCYWRPGIFAWAFNPAKAATLTGAKSAHANFPGQWRTQADGAQHTVLLLDEIDKAEPDLPNDLLEPLDRRSFALPDGRRFEAADTHRTLTFITSNGERELPQAFVRRCVRLHIDHPDKNGLVAIAKQHFPDAKKPRVEAIAAKVENFRKELEEAGQRPPGTSEFLDAVRACEKLDVQVADSAAGIWPHIEQAVLLKAHQA